MYVFLPSLYIFDLTNRLQTIVLIYSLMLLQKCKTYKNKQYTSVIAHCSTVIRRTTVICRRNRYLSQHCRYLS